MKAVHIFSAVAPALAAYARVQEQANAWLREHPDVLVISAQPAVHGTDSWTEFSLTMVVQTFSQLTPQTIETSEGIKIEVSA